MLKNNIDLSQQSDLAIVESLGRKIRSLRLESDLTQGQLADRAGLARTTIVKLEQGKSATILTLIRILRVLDRLDILDGFREEAGISPLEAARILEKAPKRASGKSDDRKRKKT